MKGVQSVPTLPQKCVQKSSKVDQREQSGQRADKRTKTSQEVRCEEGASGARQQSTEWRGSTEADEVMMHGEPDEGTLEAVHERHTRRLLARKNRVARLRRKLNCRNQFCGRNL